MKISEAPQRLPAAPEQTAGGVRFRFRLCAGCGLLAFPLRLFLQCRGLAGLTQVRPPPVAGAEVALHDLPTVVGELRPAPRAPRLVFRGLLRGEAFLFSLVGFVPGLCLFAPAFQGSAHAGVADRIPQRLQMPAVEPPEDLGQAAHLLRYPPQFDGCRLQAGRRQ